MRKSLLFIAVILIGVLSAQGQEVKKQKSSEVYAQCGGGVNYTYFGNGNLSPLGLAYQNDFKTFAPSIRFSIMGSFSGSKNIQGLIMEFTQSYNSLKSNCNSNLSLYSIGWGTISKYTHKHFYYTSESGLSYLYYNNKIIPWDSKISTGKVTAHGFEFSLATTIGYKMKKDCMLNSIGLKFGLKCQKLFKWLGDKRFIDDNSYNNKGIFGEKSNIGLYPVIGFEVHFGAGS